MHVVDCVQLVFQQSFYYSEFQCLNVSNLIQYCYLFFLCPLHCKNEYFLSNQYNCGNRLQALLLIKLNKLELSNNESNYSLKVNHLKCVRFTPKK